MKMKALVLIALAGIVQLACGVSRLPTTPVASIGGPAAPTTQSSQAQPTEASAAPGVDVSSYIACEIVRPNEVADLVGGTVFRELEQEPSPNCMYEIKTGSDSYSQFIVYIQPTSLVEPLIETMPETLGKPVAGLGDVAYLDLREDSQTYDLLVLVRGRFGLEVLGDSEEHTLALGRLFLSRLLGP